MGFEEAQDRGQRRWFAERAAQMIGGQPGQRKQSLRPIFLAQRPGQRAQGQRCSIAICVCIALRHRLDIFPNNRSGWDVAKKVLVVEDNDLNRKLFCDLLRAHDYEPEPLSDGREALATAKAKAPDLIIMDIQMPHVSGLDLIGALKSDAGLKTIPIMAVTAYAAKGDEERIREAGAESYVSKPISVVKFIEEVKTLA